MKIPAILFLRGSHFIISGIRFPDRRDYFRKGYPEMILYFCTNIFCMELFTIFLIAVSLSFDTFAVSISSGLALPKINLRNAVRIAGILAFFQALMPVAGWLAGKGFSELIKDYDHWIAFILLVILGGKMIYESLVNGTEERNFNPLDLKVCILMAIATSIDALVVGVSFAFLEFRIVVSTLMIGLVTFVVSLLGIFFGRKVGARLGKRMEIVGGLMLVLIGLKILLEHLA